MRKKLTSTTLEKWVLQGFKRGSKDRLTGPDRALAARFVSEVEDVFERHGVELTPLLALRVQDVLVSYLVVRRLEETLRRDGIVLGEHPHSSDEEEGKPARVHPALEAAAKARERLRRAVHELEEACTRAGTPIDLGLADRMKPILKQARGVLDEALASSRDAGGLEGDSGAGRA
jgi:hypothetical protein